MSLRPRLDLRQTQQLTMSPQMQQAIALLQMSSVELQAFLNDEIERNPLLEEGVREEAHGDDPKPEPMESPTANDLDMASHQPAEGKSEFSKQTEFLAQQSTLRDHLLGQIPLISSDAKITAIATILVDELDDDGYLRTPIFEIADRLGLNTDTIEDALSVLQSCDPTGVAARDLAECYALQLDEKDQLTPQMTTFLDRIELIAERAKQKIWSEIGIGPEEYADLLRQIRLLNPAPGKQFDQNITEFAVPDVSVFRDNLGGWSVELIRSNLPAITVKSAYAAEVAKRGNEEARFVSECSTRANWLVRTLNHRSDTILKVAAEIVRVQENFFSLGISHLNPLTLKEVADKLKIHESTVSRVTTSKYLICERGNFELKFFFSQAIKGSGGSGSRSSLSVQDDIRRIIDKENPSRTLSDDKIVKLLNESGIDIARRTVTKYREAMNIPSSVERRRFKSNLDKIRS